MFEVPLNHFWANTLLLERNLAKFWKVKNPAIPKVFFNGIWDPLSSGKTEFRNFVCRRGENYMLQSSYVYEFSGNFHQWSLWMFKTLSIKLKKIKKINQSMLYYNFILYYSPASKTSLVKLSIKRRGNCLFFKRHWNHQNHDF